MGTGSGATAAAPVRPAPRQPIRIGRAANDNLPGWSHAMWPRLLRGGGALAAAVLVVWLIVALL